MFTASKVITIYYLKMLRKSNYIRLQTYPVPRIQDLTKASQKGVSDKDWS